MTDPSHIKSAMLSVLVENTELSHATLKKIVDEQLVAMATSTKYLRGSYHRENLSAEADVEKLLSVIAALND